MSIFSNYFSKTFSKLVSFATQKVIAKTALFASKQVLGGRITNLITLILVLWRGLKHPDEQVLSQLPPDWVDPETQKHPPDLLELLSSGLNWVRQADGRLNR